MFTSGRKTAISVAWISAAATVIALVVCVINFEDFIGAGGQIAPAINIICAVVLTLIISLWSSIWLSIEAFRERRRILDTDRLTGVSNQFKFTKDAAEIIKRNRDKLYAVLQMDINGLRLINDIYGYDECDNLLKVISKKCLMQIGEGELLGAEDSRFILLLEYKDKESLVKRIEDLTMQLETAGNDCGSAVRFDINTGVCFVKGGESVDVRLLIDRAHIACDRSRNDIYRNWSCYDENTRDRLVEERNIVEGLNAAMDLHQLVVYYQPKFDTQTMEIVGAEALSRWNHPSMGMLPPAKFIPLLEKDFRISKLDLYVMEEVCKQIRKWLDDGRDVKPISVNVSRTHLMEENVVGQYCEIVERTGISPSYIELEMTETSVNLGGERLREIMSKMREAGFRISIDDFGNGMSSLNMLADINADILKMDCGFFRNKSDVERSKRVILLIIELAKSMNMEVVAEGVETKEQCEFLCDAGCATAQGTYYSAAIDPIDFEKLAFEEAQSVR
ncbi:MAG: EAL domain-containing protein [Ruminococcaceae bacterium]|nr:EAL domain-containing protein [Oscillospiraceae bacterium]